MDLTELIGCLKQPGFAGNAIRSAHTESAVPEHASQESKDRLHLVRPVAVPLLVDGIPKPLARRLEYRVVDGDSQQTMFRLQRGSATTGEKTISAIYPRPVDAHRLAPFYT